MNEILFHIDKVTFERLYAALRKKEARLYSDQEVSCLPFIHNSHPHYREWDIRKNSCRALLNYIKQKEKFTSILEVGCGNGWLCARMANTTDAAITGVDPNGIEIEQAKRVFGKIPDLKFMKGTLQSGGLADLKFDMILFAASIQYFPSLNDVVNTAFEHLTLQGEIHIMDSPFYHPQEKDAARQRTKEYFNKMGSPEMSRYYFHHSISDLGDFQYKVLHHPHSWKNKLSIKKNPFYWISIKNRYS